MSSDETLLEALVKDGQMDYTAWPSLLESILSRLERIAYNEFPAARIPMPDFIPSSQKEERMSMERDSRSKEEPTPIASRSKSLEKDDQDTKRDPLGTDDQSSTKPERLSKSPSSYTIAPPPHTLPPPLLSLLQTIQSTLTRSFPIAPPYTAQRLAELLLHPTTHYRTLPSYLRALDRIVSVASPASVFPLPDLTAGMNSNGRMLNGTSSPSPDPSSDRNSIGGAELTEIPWLRNIVSTPPATTLHNGAATSDLRTESTSLIDGPNGAGSIETVTVNVNGISSHTQREDSAPGITQGEILRQEQEAGIVPVPSPHNSRITRSSTASAAAAATRAVGAEPIESMDAEDEIESVHARGPGVIGMEDMGPQAPSSGLAGGLDLEGALGRRGEGETMASAVGREGEEQEKEDARDADVVIADADGVIESGEGVNGRGENHRVDAVNGTTM